MCTPYQLGKEQINVVVEVQYCLWWVMWSKLKIKNINKIHSKVLINLSNEEEFFLQIQTRISNMLLTSSVHHEFSNFVHEDVWSNACMCLWILYIVYIEVWTIGSWNAKQRYIMKRRRKQRNEFNDEREKRIVTYKWMENRLPFFDTDDIDSGLLWKWNVWAKYYIS